jgi:hypothetical protein
MNNYPIVAYALAGDGILWIALVVVLFLVFVGLIVSISRKRDTTVAPVDTIDKKGRGMKSGSANGGQFDPELIAVLTAAAEAALNKPIKITTISFLSNPESRMWSVSGRINIMASHLNVKRK